MAFYIWGSQETERLVPPVPVVILDSGGNNESCASLPLWGTKASNTGDMPTWSTCRDTYSVSHLYSPTKWCRRQTMGFWVVGSNPTIHTKKTFSDFPHVELEKYSPRYPQEMKPLGY